MKKFVWCGRVWVRSILLLVSMRLAAAPLPRSTPEAEGVSSAGLLRFVNTLDREGGGVHSVMVVRHGRVILEGWWAPYTPDMPHELYSLSKSFTSTAVGMAVAEGRLSVDDEVLRFFPSDTPENPSAHLRAMRARDLLTMSAGHQDETSSAADRISPKSFLAHPVPHKPGTHFKYNTPATFMLSAIVQARTGSNVLDYLRPRLFEPLGIEGATWDTNTAGISLGGYGLKVRTEDIAKFGELYRRKGMWNGRRLLPEAWVDLATSRQMSNGSNPKSDWDQGYGFQFWRCRNGAYRGDGAFGQYCIVMPEQDTVVAITSGLKDMQAILDRVWSGLLPLLGRDPLASQPEELTRLRQRLASLSLPGPLAEGVAGAEARILGKRWRFENNDARLESLQVERDDAGWAIGLKQGGKEVRWWCGRDAWRPGRAPFGNRADAPVAIRGAWTSGDTFTLWMAVCDAPYVTTIRLKFEGDRLSYDAEANVGFGGTRQHAEGRSE